MRILGVDPGLQVTGYGLIEIDPARPRRFHLLEAGTIEPRQADLLQNRINKVYTCLTEIVSEHHPGVVILEKLYAHYRHPTTACMLGHVRGVICLVCARRGVALEEFSVKRVRKNLVGDGSASKQQTREVVAHLLGVNAQQLTLDASDALALALAFGFMEQCGGKVSAGKAELT